MQYKRKNVGSEREEYPFKDSPSAVTFTNEIKRIAQQREEDMSLTMEKLAKVVSLNVRQIYNYRMGRTQIPDNLILIFCRQLRSTAMAAAWLREQDAMDELENFDLIKLANESAQETLKVHQQFLESFEDGQIDGFEFSESKRRTAKAVACFHRLDQVVEDAYNRRRAA